MVLFLSAAFPTVSFRLPPSPRFALKAYARKVRFEYGLLKCKPLAGTCSAGTMHSYFPESAEKKYFQRYGNHPETLTALWGCTSSDMLNLSSLGKCSIFSSAPLFISVTCAARVRDWAVHRQCEKAWMPFFSRTVFFNPSRVWLLTTTYAAANVLFCQRGSRSDKISKWNI